MSMIAEQAGGCGSTGFQRVLDIVPEKVGAGGGGRGRGGCVVC
jgi:hypothetical protein